MNHRIQFIFICVQIFYLSFLFAAENEYQFEIITTRNGLSDNDIRAVTDDRYGFIWLATDEGFNRYDGYEVKTTIQIHLTPLHYPVIEFGISSRIRMEMYGRLQIKALIYTITEKIRSNGLLQPAVQFF